MRKKKKLGVKDCDLVNTAEISNFLLIFGF